MAQSGANKCVISIKKLTATGYASLLAKLLYIDIVDQKATHYPGTLSVIASLHVKSYIHIRWNVAYTLFPEAL